MRGENASGSPMRWEDFRRSDNVEDRRGQRPLMRAGGLGIGTIAVLGIAAWMLGINPILLIGGAELFSSARHSYEAANTNKDLGPRSASSGKPNDATGEFVAAVLGETEDSWSEIFKSLGKTYRAPKLVMFSDATDSACG